MCIQRDSVAALARLRKRALGGGEELDVLPGAFAVGDGRNPKLAVRNGIVGEAG